MRVKLMQILILLSALSLFGGGVLFAQTADRMDVSGTVVDRNGEPVVGASVIVIGTMKGTITDIDGAFYLSNVAKDATLSVDLLGYKTAALPLAGRSKVNIVLEDDALALEESVVVGYGQMKKSDLTGSVASVKPEKLTDIPANSIDGLLQGRVAGVQVINSSQDPGAASTIRIRGNSSLNGSNAPLVVIDGFPYGDAGDLKQINPQDIVSMEVLKDASASAIYGSRGANGVILITTRKARENNTKIIVRQQTTMSQFSSKLNLWRDPVLMAMLSNESNINAGLTPTYVGAVNANGVYYPSIEELKTTWTTNTRWDDIVFRDVPVSDNTTVQVQSSNDKTTFLASANYYRDNGMYIQDYYQKYGGNFSVEHKIYDNLRMKASANITCNKRNNNSGLSYSRNPIFPVYDENGDYWQYSVQDYYHPLALTNLQKNVSTGLDLISFASLSYDPLDCLNISAQLNYKHGESTTDKYFPKKYSETGTFNNGYGSINNWKDDNVVADIYATFDKTFGGKHHLTAMAGYSYENYQSRSSFLASKGYVNESLGNENLASGDPETYSISNGAYKTELVSAMVRLNYAFDNRYLLTFTARADGSSKLAPGHRWGLFPSVSAAWRISGEEFMKNVSWIDDLKLRVGWGQQGNQSGLDDYAWVQMYGINYTDWTKTENADSTPTLGTKTNIGNKDLTWETTTQTNVGIDWSMFRGRLNVTLDGYYKYTKNLLMNVPLPAPNPSIYRNEGEMSNWGLELAISSVNIDRKDWKWTTDFNISTNRNKLEKLTLQQVYYYTQTSEALSEYVVRMTPGESLSKFWGYTAEGVDPETGMIIYKDMNGDGKINVSDKHYIGDANPWFTAGMTNTISWKGLSLSFLLTASVGNDIYNASKIEMIGMYTGANQIKDAVRRWRVPGQITDIPKAGELDNLRASTRWVEDGSYLKFKNITLSYDITCPKLRKANISRIQPYITLDNMVTFTGYSGYDPEMSQYTSATNTGIDWGTYPCVKTVLFGVNVEF